MWSVASEIYNLSTTPHIQVTIFKWTYLRCYRTYSDISMRVILHIWCQIQGTRSCLRCENCGPVHIQCNYRSAYSGFNIQLTLPALLLEICRYLDARYTANLVPFMTHTLQLTLCELWSRSHTKHLQLRIFRPQYSTERICAAIGDMATIQCGLYYKLCAKCSAHTPVYAMWTVASAIYKVFTAPHS
jgi:hypothetical protein